MYYKKGLDVVKSEVELPDWEEITQEEYERIIDVHRQVADLQFELKRTDYKALKYAEGYYTEEVYVPIKEHRQELRNQINALLESI